MGLTTSSHDGAPLVARLHHVEKILTVAMKDSAATAWRQPRHRPQLSGTSPPQKIRPSFRRKHPPASIYTRGCAVSFHLRSWPDHAYRYKEPQPPQSSLLQKQLQDKYVAALASFVPRRRSPYQMQHPPQGDQWPEVGFKFSTSYQPRRRTMKIAHVASALLTKQHAIAKSSSTQGTAQCAQSENVDVLVHRVIPAPPATPMTRD